MGASKMIHDECRLFNLAMKYSNDDFLLSFQILTNFTSTSAYAFNKQHHLLNKFNISRIVK